MNLHKYDSHAKENTRIHTLHGHRDKTWPVAAFAPGPQATVRYACVYAFVYANGRSHIMTTLLSRFTDTSSGLIVVAGLGICRKRCFRLGRKVQQQIINVCVSNLSKTVRSKSLWPSEVLVHPEPS